MKKEKVKYIITKTPAQINKVMDKVIDKLKDTPEWKRTAKRFTKKAMEVISKL
jgi:ribosomal protein L15